METYKILLSIALSGILWSIYKLILSGHKIFHFNRYFLLATVVISLALPWIPLSLFSKNVLPATSLLQEIPTLEINGNYSSKASTGINWVNILLIVYLAISFLLFFRFTRNIIRLILQIIQNKKLDRDGVCFVLVPHVQQPYTFLKYIFLSENDLSNNKVAPQILIHERAHAIQHHSLDILLIESLIIFAWFNPFFWLVRRDIHLNHEFLADEAAIEKSSNPNQYRQLIINHITQTYHNQFASNFNYLLTKKRFIMMTKKTSPSKANLLKVSASALLITTIGIGFSLNAKELKDVSPRISEPAPPITEQMPQESAKVSPEPIIAKTTSDAQEVAPNKTAEDLLSVPTPREAQILTDTISKPQNTVTPTEQAQFSSGLTEYRKKFMANFVVPTGSDIKGAMKTIISFVVDKDGTVNDIEANGDNKKFNEAAVAAVKIANQSGEWVPAKQNGVPIKSHFKMPIMMSFDD